MSLFSFAILIMFQFPGLQNRFEVEGGLKERTFLKEYQIWNIKIFSFCFNFKLKQAGAKLCQAQLGLATC